MTAYLIFGISYAFAAAIQPGPLQTFLIAQTLKKGWQKTLPAAFAPIISDIPIACLMLFLLNSVPDNFITLLRFTGGLFLIYLAYSAFKSWRAYRAKDQISKQSGNQTFYSAIIVNILNPHPYLGWSLVMGPMFIEGWQVSALNGFALIIGFYLTLIFALSATIILFAFARNFGPNVIKSLLGLSALVLLLFGIYQLWEGISYFY